MRRQRVGKERHALHRARELEMVTGAFQHPPLSLVGGAEHDESAAACGFAGDWRTFEEFAPPDGCEKLAVVENALRQQIGRIFRQGAGGKIFVDDRDLDSGRHRGAGTFGGVDFVFHGWFGKCGAALPR